MIPLLRFLARSSRGVVVVSIVAGAASGASGVALLAVIQAELARESPGSGRLGAAFAALCLVSGISRVVAQAAMVRLGQGAVALMTREVAGRILALPLRAFEAMDRSSLQSVLTEDIGLIGGAIVGVPQVCINGPIVLACLAYVGWMAPGVLAVGVGFAAAAIWAYVAVSTRGVASLRRAREDQDALLGHVRTLIEGFRELKLHRGRREAFFRDGLAPATEAVRRRTGEGLAHFAVAGGWAQVMFFGFIGLALFAIPGVVAVDRKSLIAVVLVVLYLMSPLDVILNWLPVLGRASASLRRVENLVCSLSAPSLTSEEVAGKAGLALPMTQDRQGKPCPTESLPISPLPEGEGGRFDGRPLDDFDSIELDGVTFSYEGGFALGPIDLNVRRGEIAILAGGNGSGKTTLVKLLAGLYSPDGGSVRIDGRTVAEADREAYRGLFSLVHADGHLFQDVLGLDPADLETRALEGLDRLGLADEVALDGRRFSTVDLSQGRRRRLALLGALLEDRPVLILDEWAANQDPSFKRFYYRELLAGWKALGKTLVVISHDEAYFGVADRVIWLGEGHVADASSVVLAGRGEIAR